MRKELAFNKECEVFEQLKRNKYSQFKRGPSEVDLRSDSQFKNKGGIKYLSFGKLSSVQNQEYTTVIKRYVNNPEKFKNASFNEYILAKEGKEV